MKVDGIIWILWAFVILFSCWIISRIPNFLFIRWRTSFWNGFKPNFSGDNYCKTPALVPFADPPASCGRPHWHAHFHLSSASPDQNFTSAFQPSLLPSRLFPPSWFGPLHFYFLSRVPFSVLFPTMWWDLTDIFLKCGRDLSFWSPVPVCLSDWVSFQCDEMRLVGRSSPFPGVINILHRAGASLPGRIPLQELFPSAISFWPQRDGAELSCLRRVTVRQMGQPLSLCSLGPSWICLKKIYFLPYGPKM